MLPDNRLDFITAISPAFIEMMTDLRSQFIELDQKLRLISAMTEGDREGVNRCLSLARTNIETACQFTIKALCIMGELKPVPENECQEQVL